MPLKPSDYRPPWWLRNGHVQTLFPFLFRRVARVPYVQERISTPDKDFLDLDWLRSSRTRLAVISHGLEGSSRAKYVRGMALALQRRGWDVLAWNFRGCSGEPNRCPRLYHSGVTDDLHLVLTHALGVGGYAHAALVGFSMGGNQILKYLGENPGLVPRQVRAAAAFSVPCDLEGAATAMARPENRIYMARFLRSLRAKIREKSRRFPGCLSLDGLAAMRTFQEFDDRFTAPLHGFADARDYYRSSGAIRFLETLALPVLLVNAADDPFLGPSCFPRQQARAHPFLHLECPEHGGHVGFAGRMPLYWSESRAAEFLEEFANP
jgi:uncharacterized protein